ncbi:MAG: hypothetical protein GQ574_25420 [Crocinitomix sp.]|nr:hypothetical protein [Crocinitomix sp.]
MKRKPEENHLFIEYPEMFSNLFSEEDLLLSHENLLVDCRKKGIEMYAALEWAIPTAVVVYILKPYFDSFLKEAGKDHYKWLTQKMKNLLKKSRKIEATLVHSDLSPKKNTEGNNQSNTISLRVQIKEGRFVKLLFDKNMTVEEWESAIDQLLEFVIDNYENGKESKLFQIIEPMEQYHDIYSTINKETGKIEFTDITTLVEISKRNSK